MFGKWSSKPFVQPQPKSAQEWMAGPSARPHAVTMAAAYQEFLKTVTNDAQELQLAIEALQSTGIHLPQLDEIKEIADRFAAEDKTKETWNKFQREMQAGEPAKAELTARVLLRLFNRLVPESINDGNSLLDLGRKFTVPPQSLTEQQQKGLDSFAVLLGNKLASILNGMQGLLERYNTTAEAVKEALASNAPGR